MAIPDHLYGLVQARSSTSKQELLVLPGLIDPGWRGKILVMTYNLADSSTVIKEGKSIAQMIFLHRVLGLNREDVTRLRPSDRQDRGFGSTGK
jgi:dUTP pyrophosphatase